jgi:NTE family protein
MQNDAPRSLVLGAGGPVAGAWLGSLTAHLIDAGLFLPGITQVLGTSAGAVVGAWLASGADPAEVTDVMVDRMSWHAARKATAEPDSPLSQAEAASLWRRWLPGEAWPQGLRITAVALGGLGLRVWSDADSVPLGAAVAASTAVPGLVPPVRLGEHAYVDGSVRSPTNADAAATQIDEEGVEVLVCAPVATAHLRREVALLRGLGCMVTLLQPESGDLAGAFTSASGVVQDPALIHPAVEDGRACARRVLATRAKSRIADVPS